MERCLACEAVVNKGEVVTSDEAGSALFSDKANRHKIELRQNGFWNPIFPCSPRPRKRGTLQQFTHTPENESPRAKYQKCFL